MLLTQTTDDLEFEREGVARFLAQADVRVLPEGDLPQGGAEFAAAYARDLHSADLVVQLLSQAAGRAPADMPGGYQHHQQSAAVEAGNADAAVVYRTDAIGRSQVRIAYQVDPAQGPQIVYPAAVVKTSRHPELARAFVETLAGPEGQAVLRRLGFEMPAAERR